MGQKSKKQETLLRPSEAFGTSADIPVDEQWRLVNESGILQGLVSQIPKQEHETVEPLTFGDEIFNTLTFLIPFSALYFCMDILIHQQYAQQATFKEEFGRMVSAVPILAIFIFYTNRHKENRLMQAAMCLASIACGTRMIYVVNRSSWTVVMQQAPPLSTLWIYFIVQLPLLQAVLTLVVVASAVGYTGWKIVF